MANFDIAIRDFQALEVANISVVDGLNIIIGDTNNGKSAVLRAIEDALFNSGLDSRVRAGQRYSAVKINNGKDTLMWRRDSHGKNNKTMYQITGVNGGKPIEKVGRIQLDEVITKFGITEVKMSNNNKERVNFWKQGEAPFLTDKTPAQLFEFLSLSSCDEYIKVLKQMKSDVRDLNGKILSLGSKIDTLNAINEEKKDFIDRNEGFDDLYAQIVITNQEVEKFNTLEDVVTRVQTLQTRLDNKHIELNKVNDSLKTVNIDSLTRLKREVEDVGIRERGLFNLFSSIKVKQSQIKDAKIQLDKIDSRLSTGSDIELLRDIILDLNEKTLFLDKINPIMKSVKFKKESLKILKEDLLQTSKAIDNVDIDSFVDEMRRYFDIEKKKDEIYKLLGAIKQKRTSKDYLEDELETLIDRYEDAKISFKRYKDELGGCPLCGGKL